jgi:hypothetical protein
LVTPDLTEKNGIGAHDNPDKWFLYRKYEDALKDGFTSFIINFKIILWKKVIK